MVNKSEIQIFLAHANEDKEEVLKLYDRLKKAGYKPWLDKKNLIPGQNWRSVIPRAIKDSQLFIACLSTRSISKRGYVQNEFKIALNQLASIPSDSIYFIPLRLDECQIPDLRQDEYGLNLRDIHWLDYWEADGFEMLERAISYKYGSLSQEPSILDNTELGDKVAESELVDRVTESVERVELKTNQFQSFTEDLGNGIKLDMIAIPGGTFMMGTEDEEIERLVKKFNWDGFIREKPQHKVTVQPFYMGKYPVTQAQYQQIMGKNSSKFKGDDQRSVEQVSWDDAVEFCKKLSKQTGREYLLPTEAEWEYACRASTTTAYYFGESITREQVNYYETVGTTTAVGKYPPNAFGLYDMHGNVWEWCQDNWHENYEGVPIDGSAWVLDDSNYYVARGGSWAVFPYICRSAFRSGDARDNRSDVIGFRVACIASNIT